MELQLEKGPQRASGCCEVLFLNLGGGWLHFQYSAKFYVHALCSSLSVSHISQRNVIKIILYLQKHCLFFYKLCFYYSFMLYHMSEKTNGRFYCDSYLIRFGSTIIPKVLFFWTEKQNHRHTASGWDPEICALTSPLGDTEACQC